MQHATTNPASPWPLKRGRQFFRDNPIVAARYFLPGVGALVHLYGATDMAVIKEVARRARQVPCTAAGLRQGLAELTLTPSAALEGEYGVGPEHTRIFSRVRGYLLKIPPAFWEAVYREMEETPAKQKGENDV